VFGWQTKRNSNILGKSKRRLTYIGETDDIGVDLKRVQNRKTYIPKWPWNLAKDMNIEEENYNKKKNNENTLEVNWTGCFCGPFTRGVDAGGGAI
jgi:hypothetical protein